jgi:NO-binding membrane sensor protein with MHYT domain
MKAERMTEQGAILVGHNNYLLLLMSVFIAMVSAHAALDLATRVAYAREIAGSYG